MGQDWIKALEKVCSFTQAKSGTLILDVYDNPEYVIHRNFDNVRKWDTNKYNLTPN